MSHQFTAKYFYTTTPPAPALNVITGTEDADRLIGNIGDDLIRGSDGNDRLSSRAGENTVVFGGDARDGNRDRDTITVLNVGLEAQSAIQFTDGVFIA